jgi:hypothetical protein
MIGQTLSHYRITSALGAGGMGDVYRVDEPQLSPDERWLAYVSRESGRDEVYVEPYRREGDRGCSSRVSEPAA